MLVLLKLVLFKSLYDFKASIFLLLVLKSISAPHNFHGLWK